MKNTYICLAPFFFRSKKIPGLGRAHIIGRGEQQGRACVLDHEPGGFALVSEDGWRSSVG